MNQRGEMLSLSTLLILVMSSFLILCSLELRKEHLELKNRSRLFLCTKEFKGELTSFMSQMGRTNWAIKNLDQLSKASLLIPGFQGVAMKSAKARKLIILYQNTLLISYLKKLGALKGKSCPIAHEIFKTPYQITFTGFIRDKLGGALLRNSHLTYSLKSGRNILLLKSSLRDIEKMRPDIFIESSEIREKLFFPSFSL